MVAFNDVFIDDTKNGRKIPKEEYLTEGLYPIIDQGQEYIAGYSNDKSGIYENVPVVIFGDHTRIVKYVDVPFFLGADGVKVLKVKGKDVNHKYFYYALSNARIPDTGYNRHFKWLKELDFNLANKEKQDVVVEVLDKLDSLIKTRKQQLQKIDELVKARFVEMFGLPVANTKCWNTEKMSVVAPVANYVGDFDDDVWLLNLDMIEAQSGRILDYLIVGKNEVGSSTCTFDTSNVLYSKLRPYLNKVVIPDRCGYATSELIPLQPIRSKINREYLTFVLRSDEFVAMINEKVVGAKMPRVSMSDFRNFDVPVPPLELQNKFADFVRQNDKSKLSVQQSLEKLETLKKALMQKYFG